MSVSQAIQTDSPQFSWRNLLTTLHYALGPKKNRTCVVVLLLFVVYFDFLIPPYILGVIVDLFSTRQPEESLHSFYLLAALIALTYSAAAIIRLNCKKELSGIAIHVACDSKMKCFERLLNQSLAWHGQENAGNKIERIQNGSSALADLLRIVTSSVLPVIAKFTGVLAIFFTVGAEFFIFCVAYLALYFCVSYVYYRYEQTALKELNQALESASGAYFEGASNILAIHALGCQDSITSKILLRENAVRDWKFKQSDLGIAQWKAYQHINSLGMFILLVLIGRSVSGGYISIGEVFTYFSYFLSLSLSSGELVNVFGDLIKAKVAIARISPLLDSFVKDNQQVNSFPENWQTIEIIDGDFTYPGTSGNFRLSGLNLKIRRGERIGIVGGSGSGKSTISKLLLGMYQLDKGVIKIDGIEIQSIIQSSITDNVAIVLQESELFNMSLKDNITLMRDCSAETLVNAIEIAKLEHVIAKCPSGLDSDVGEHGYRLSGGERQRIAIARAICKNASLLILDEATSALDGVTEQDVLAELLSNSVDRTLLVIAHRITALKQLDRIVVLENGKVVEDGRYNDLLSNPNTHFYKLAASQIEPS